LGNRLEWEQAGRDWPNREVSRFVSAAGLRWHVQRMGRGPAALLVHGTGAANHSWRCLAPLLARHFTVIAPDLPGHGFTAAPPSGLATLPGMASALSWLLRTLGVSPELVVGHSAGAAIAARMRLDGGIDPRGLVSLNGALLPLRGLPGYVFSPMAKLAANPLVSRLIARRAADPSAVERLIRNTGSTLDPAGVELYGRLMRNPGHVAGALGMMAGWDLRTLERELSRLAVPLVLVVGENDRTVSPAEARRLHARLPAAEFRSLPGLGHLAHEEAPRRVAAIVLEFARRVGALRRP
jgi:magnesium chelatase accessory protein